MKNIIKFPTPSKFVNGNLALKMDAINTNNTTKTTEQPKVKKIVIGKRKPRVFAGCWQEANGQDFC